MSRTAKLSLKQASWQFWLLCAFLCLTFLTGGASRADVQSLAILRPVSVVVFGISIAGLRLEDLARYRTLVVFALLIIFSVALYLLPLPQAILAAFPVSDINSVVERTISLDQASHTAALVPQQAWNSFFSLFIPLSVLSLAIQLNRQDLFRLLPLLLALGVLSGLVGLMQVLSGPNGPFYFYQITNNSSAVGFFANRNHQAVLLTMLFPMLAVYASTSVKSVEQSVFRVSVGLAVGAFLIPLILVTGSRAGLVIGIFAIIAALLLYRKPQGLTPPKRKAAKRDLRIPLVALGVVALGFVSIILSRAEAFDRLTATDGPRDFRLEFWGPIFAMAKQNLPFGSGPGSLPDAYAYIEPSTLLNTGYLNRAHNDWLEAFANFGLPGVILIVAAMVAILIRFRSLLARENQSARDVVVAKLGFLMILIAAAGSISDYPLRTPTMSAFIVIALVWCAVAPRKTDVPSASDA